LKHLKSIDFIRALAVFIVVAGHFLPQYSRDQPLGMIQHLLQPTGAFAVNLFFVLSGFLITTILLNDKERTSDRFLVVRNFLIRRTLRIFPIYFLLLIILVTIDFPFLPGELPYQFSFTSNYFFFGLATPTHTGHTWSLAVEEQFYLFWPWLIIFISRFYHSYVFFFCTLVSLISGWYFGCADDFSCGLSMNLLTTTNLVAFAIGGMYASLVQHQKGQENIGKIIFYSLIVTCPLFIYWLMTPLFSLEHRFEFLRVAVYSVLSISIIHYIMGIKNGPVKTRLIDHPWIGLTGRISYGIYLFHLPIQYYFTRHLIIWASEQGLPNSLFLWFIPFCITVFVTAYLSYVMIEKPILNYKERFNLRRS
jgi:peptidoglycan/LPS O-acetylase OafA/YrhL